jgi:hypothetical protein
MVALQFANIAAGIRCRSACCFAAGPSATVCSAREHGSVMASRIAAVLSSRHPDTSALRRLAT